MTLAAPALFELRNLRRGARARRLHRISRAILLPRTRRATAAVSFGSRVGASIVHRFFAARHRRPAKLALKRASLPQPSHVKTVSSATARRATSLFVALLLLISLLFPRCRSCHVAISLSVLTQRRTPRKLQSRWPPTANDERQAASKYWKFGSGERAARTRLQTVLKDYESGTMATRANALRPEPGGGEFWTRYLMQTPNRLTTPMRKRAPPTACAIASSPAPSSSARAPAIARSSSSSTLVSDEFETPPAAIDAARAVESSPSSSPPPPLIASPRLVDTTAEESGGDILEEIDIATVNSSTSSLASPVDDIDFDDATAVDARVQSTSIETLVAAALTPIDEEDALPPPPPILAFRPPLAAAATDVAPPRPTLTRGLTVVQLAERPLQLMSSSVQLQTSEPTPSTPLMHRSSVRIQAATTQRSISSSAISCTPTIAEETRAPTVEAADVPNALDRLLATLEAESQRLEQAARLFERPPKSRTISIESADWAELPPPMARLRITSSPFARAARRATDAPSCSAVSDSLLRTSSMLALLTRLDSLDERVHPRFTNTAGLLHQAEFALAVDERRALPFSTSVALRLSISFSSPLASVSSLFFCYLRSRQLNRFSGTTPAFNTSRAPSMPNADSHRCAPHLDDNRAPPLCEGCNRQIM